MAKRITTQIKDLFKKREKLDEELQDIYNDFDDLSQLCPHYNETELDILFIQACKHPKGLGDCDIDICPFE